MSEATTSPGKPEPAAAVDGERGLETKPQRLKELFAELAEQRVESLGELYDLAAPRLYGLALWRTANAEDARDVVQEVFVRLAEKRHRLAKVRDPLSWLLTVTHRVAVDLTRRRRLREALPIDEEVILASSGEDPDLAVDAERASALMMQLPAAQREVVYLRHFAEYTFAAIGDVVGVPTFTAASRYRLGLRRLRRLLEKGESP